MIYDVSVIGLGYIGLPTAAMFASRKLRVIGIDINETAVETINRGEIHIVEPDLDQAVHSAVTDGFLHASTSPAPAKAFLVAVPTPFRGTERQPDLSYVQAAARTIAPVLQKESLVVLESTSPVGATEQLAEWLAHERPDLSFPQNAGENADVRIAYCPERVLPGKVMHELIENDRVIGGMTAKCSAAAVKLYKTFVKGDCIVTNARTAEMVKLTENSFRDVNIAFANELSLICDKLDVDVWELISLANRHPRVNILRPGPGVGGHCIAVDPWFIVSRTPEEAKIIRTAREVNDAKPDWVVAKVTEAANRISNPSIICMGLAFKPDIDDLRESPALSIATEIASRQLGTVTVCEPFVAELPKELSERGVAKVAEPAVSDADIVVFLTAHSQFCNLAGKISSSATVIDACGVLAQ
ncbi:UDP-N-acetyl-D-mannosamine dehydrogenase [Croceicoccus sp. Ery15]|uniref:UDP-N-acetyl-D-mannosamine dehydrogenase n=1 Tax=Croceicoccus sp. Ery15 TaxID=1703338 RepID=UPI001E5BE13A|nr:UDP-N-acetyl-D-mannosamine dehydrogenase [Croceicoccus sp. Ery15]